jgi:hypothetical protein
MCPVLSTAVTSNDTPRRDPDTGVAGFVQAPAAGLPGAMPDLSGCTRLGLMTSWFTG